MGFFKKKKRRIAAEVKFRGFKEFDVAAMDYMKVNNGECSGDLDTPAFIRKVWREKCETGSPKMAKQEPLGASRFAFEDRRPAGSKALAEAMCVLRRENELIMADYFELAEWFMRFRNLLTPREWSAGVEAIERIGNGMVDTEPSDEKTSDEINGA